MIDLTDYPTPWKAELDTNDTGKWWRVSAVNGMRITGDLPRDIAHLIAASPELYKACEEAAKWSDGDYFPELKGMSAGIGGLVMGVIGSALAKSRGEVE